jgi:hypothetical protein
VSYAEDFSSDEELDFPRQGFHVKVIYAGGGVDPHSSVRIAAAQPLSLFNMNETCTLNKTVVFLSESTPI